MSRYLSLFLVLALAGCTFNTAKGPCIGLTADGDKDKTYEFKVWNAVVTAVLSETLVVPAVWFFTDARCPKE